MRRFRPYLVTVSAVLLSAVAASAANVHFEIVPLLNGQPVDLATTPEITVAPGQVIDYEITTLVTSTDPAAPDNDGLAYFRFDILTDLGVPQPPVTGLEAAINDAFTLLLSLGMSSADDLIKIQAAQDTVTGRGPLITGVGLEQAQVIVGGILATPTIEGTFQVAMGGDVQASVFEPGGNATLQTATTTVGQGFTVYTLFSSSETQQDDQTTGDTEDGSDQDTTSTDNSTVDVTTQADQITDTGATNGIAFGGIALALGALSAWAFLNVGAIAGVVGLLLALVTALAYFLTQG